MAQIFFKQSHKQSWIWLKEQNRQILLAWCSFGCNFMLSNGEQNWLRNAGILCPKIMLDTPGWSYFFNPPFFFWGRCYQTHFRTTGSLENKACSEQELNSGILSSQPTLLTTWPPLQHLMRTFLVRWIIHTNSFGSCWHWFAQITNFITRNLKLNTWFPIQRGNSPPNPCLF